MFGLIRTIRNRKRNEAAFAKYGEDIARYESMGYKVRVKHDAERDVSTNVSIGKVTYSNGIMLTLTDSAGNERNILYRNIRRIESMVY